MRSDQTHNPTTAAVHRSQFYLLQSVLCKSHFVGKKIVSMNIPGKEKNLE